MSTSDNKRKVTKKTNQNVINKKVATGDANVEESGKLSNNTTIKAKQVKAEITKKEEEINPKQKLLNENARLEEELKKIKKKYETAQKKEIEEINNLNNDLDEKAKKLQASGKENVKLMKGLKDLEETLNKKYSKIMDSKLLKKRHKVVQNEETINKDIDIHKKEIQIMKKEIKREKKHQEKYKKRREEKYSNIDKLNKLNEEIQQLQ